MSHYKQMPMPPDQVLLFSQSVEDALPPESDVRSFADVMECLDYSEFERKRCERGCPPYPPAVMVRILGYAYSKGIRSSRRIEELLKVDVRFIWLAGGLKPDHNTIARFRKDNHRELELVFKDSVRVCAQAGLVFLNTVAVDGTKIKAVASKRRICSQSMLDRQLAGVERILAEAEEVDAAEDEHHGSSTGNELPDHLKDTKARKKHLEGIAQQLKHSKRASVVETEPEARVMKTQHGLRPAYNLQACVDADNQVIVAMKLTDLERDAGLLPEMVEEIESNVGMSPDISVADAGYGNEKTLQWLDENHDALIALQQQPQESARDDQFASRHFLADDERDVLICPAGRELLPKGVYKQSSGHYKRYRAAGCQSCSFYKECVPSGRGSRAVSVSIVASQRRAMFERLRSPEGKKLYELRQQTVEPVFGQMKRNRGFERLTCWGKSGARAETALMCIAHNVSKCAANAAARAYVAAVIAANASVFSLLSGFCRLHTLRTCRS